MDNVQELHTIDNLREALATWSKAASATDSDATG
jgi:hypothetical protein